MKDTLPVILNIYRIKEESFLGIFGLKVFHSAIEYDNTEYAFGYLDEPTSGIYDIKPMSYDEGTYIESITLGYVDRRTFFKMMDVIKKVYLGNTYNILFKNCNHFTNDFTKLLLQKEIPKKYTLLLKVGECIRNIF